MREKVFVSPQKIKNSVFLFENSSLPARLSDARDVSGMRRVFFRFICEEERAEEVTYSRLRVTLPS